VSYTALCSGLSKSCQEKHGRSWVVQGVLLPEHKTGEQGNAHRHQNTVRGPAEHTVTGRVGAGTGTCLFQLGHIGLFCGFFKFLSTMPL